MELISSRRGGSTISQLQWERRVTKFEMIGRGNWKVRRSRILGAVIPFRRDTARHWTLCCWVATEVGPPTRAYRARSIIHAGTVGGREDLFGKGVQSWQPNPRDKSLIFHRKSRIFSRSQRRRKFPKIRMCRRNNLRLCSSNELLALNLPRLPHFRPFALWAFEQSWP